MSRNSEVRGELCDPQLGTPRTIRYRRIVGGCQGACKSHRIGGCENKHKGRMHTGSHVHTPLCGEDPGTRASETNAEVMRRKKRAERQNRKVKKRREEGDTKESLPGSPHLEARGEACAQR